MAKKRRYTSMLLATMLVTGGLALATAAPAAAEPAITVTPDTDLVDRQSVDVAGSDFTADATFGAAQCDLARAQDDMDISACDLSTSVITSTDGAGQVGFSMTVKRFIQVQGEVIDCAVESACIIGAATLDPDLTTPIETASANIVFDPDAPAVPPLTVDVEVTAIDGAEASGTVVCNRTAQAFINPYLSQMKAGHVADRYGYDEVTCDTTPTAWTVPFMYGSGRLTGGPADYFVYADAYDGFEFDVDFAEGTIRVTGGRAPLGAVIDEPGESIAITDIRAVSDRGRQALAVTITCDQPTFVDVSGEATQLAGLATVYGYVQSEGAVPCSGETDVVLPLRAGNGRLVGGPAYVSVNVFSFDPDTFDYDFAYRAGPVDLSGRTNPPVVDVEPNPDSRITIQSTSSDELRVTVDCSDLPVVVELFASIAQARGRTIDYGFGYTFDESCDGVTAFAVPMFTEGLRNGPAQLYVEASAYTIEPGPDFDEYVFQWSDHQGAQVTLRG